MDYTLSTLRSAIDPTCFPPSATTTQQNYLINKGRELIYYTPNLEGGGNSLWRGIIQTFSLPVVSQFADANNEVFQTTTLPREMFTILAAWDINGHIDLRPEWIQYSPAARWGGRIMGDLGDGFVGSTNLNANGAKITVTPLQNEGAGETLILFGTNSQGMAQSETIAIPTVVNTTATSVLTYYTLTEIQKSQTLGYLQVNQLTAGVSTPFATYESGDTYPNYRRYQFGFFQQNTSIKARGKRQFFNLVNDSDPVEFGSVIAMEDAVRAYNSKVNNDQQNYRDLLIEAIGILNGLEAAYQMDSAEGGARMPVEFSGGGICNVL